MFCSNKIPIKNSHQPFQNSVNYQNYTKWQIIQDRCNSCVWLSHLCRWACLILCVSKTLLGEKDREGIYWNSKTRKQNGHCFSWCTTFIRQLRRSALISILDTLLHAGFLQYRNMSRRILQDTDTYQWLSFHFLDWVFDCSACQNVGLSPFSQPCLKHTEEIWTIQCKN